MSIGEDILEASRNKENISHKNTEEYLRVVILSSPYMNGKIYRSDKAGNHY
jgi:hypothetical protein